MQEKLFFDFENSSDTLWILSNSTVMKRFTEHGIRPVYHLLKNNINCLEDKVIFDKIVGRAAALLFIKAKVRRVYGIIGSFEAKKVFEEYRLFYKFKNLVANIMNQTKTDICPFERLSQGKSTETFLEALKNKF